MIDDPVGILESFIIIAAKRQKIIETLRQHGSGYTYRQLDYTSQQVDDFMAANYPQLEQDYQSALGNMRELFDSLRQRAE